MEAAGDDLVRVAHPEEPRGEAEPQQVASHRAVLIGVAGLGGGRWATFRLGDQTLRVGEGGRVGQMRVVRIGTEGVELDVPGDEGGGRRRVRVGESVAW